MGKAHILGELGAGGGEVEDGVQIGLGQLLPTRLTTWQKRSVSMVFFALVVPDVDVDDGGAGLHDGHGVGGDLLGCDGHIGASGISWLPAPQSAAVMMSFLPIVISS